MRTTESVLVAGLFELLRAENPVIEILGVLLPVVRYYTGGKPTKTTE